MAATRGGGASLTERGFHHWVRTHLPAGRSGLLPIGDDCAALPVGAHQAVLISSDALVESVHFRRSTPARRVGEAAAAFNLSDIAAKGGQPAALLVDVLAPPGTPRAWAQGVLLGAEHMAARFNCHVVGGDTKPSGTRSVVGVSVGWASTRALPTRRGARPGDLVVTTGVVGFGGAFRTNVPRALSVRPRIREGQRMGPVVHSMTDTSDGVADAAHLIAKGSRCQLTLVAESLPLHPRLGRSGHPTASQLERAFYGGDYELFATMAPSKLGALRARLRPLGCPLTVIGRVERGRGAWLEHGGRVAPLPPAGWRHFAQR